jgi:alkyl sulfatase BDS1-like metallo-beta-lactamase superfamily hydrolase
MSADLRSVGDACWEAYDSAEWGKAIENCKATPVGQDAVYIATQGVVGNVTALRTSEGLVVFDTGSHITARLIYDTLRDWDQSPIHTVIFTHGHGDHVRGAPLFDDEAKRRGEPPIRVVAQARMPARFERYVVAADFVARVNARQFSQPLRRLPAQWRQPDLLYHDDLTLSIGGFTFELHHGMGETDDHTWTFIPERKLLVSGDFVIWAAPNAGNPQKVQRYAKPWADSLRTMAACKADVLVPGHGPAVFGAGRVAQLLDEEAQVLDVIHDQTLALMNEGKPLDEIIQNVKMPDELLSRPYLQPTYDDPEFLVRNIWRLYGGWWDGDPSHLKPAPAAELARELAALAGGAARLAERANELAADGQLRLAGHLAEFAVQAEPASLDAHKARASVNQQRAKAERTTMGKGIFGAAARESQRVVDPEAGKIEARPMLGL